MNIKELKKILSRFPKNAAVSVSGNAGDDIVIRATKNQNDEWVVIISATDNTDKNQLLKSDKYSIIYLQEEKRKIFFQTYDCL